MSTDEVFATLAEDDSFDRTSGNAPKFLLRRQQRCGHSANGPQSEYRAYLLRVLERLKLFPA